MSFQITMMSGDKYLITEEEFKNFSKVKEKGLVFIPSIGGLINFSSIETVISEDKISLCNKNEVQLHDGGIAIRKSGTWYLKGHEDIKLNLHHYPELAKDELPKQLKELNKPIN